MTPEQTPSSSSRSSRPTRPHARKYGGTGLGLPSLAVFCRMMGGDVDVKSAPGEGSTFTMTSARSP